jgi:Co/Zn/Cd efflux system component
MPSVAQLQLGGRDYSVTFEEHDHGAHDHSSAHLDTTCGPLSCTCWLAPLVSVMVIVGLLLARAFGWLWMDPLAGIIGPCVIANWSWGLIRDTGAILLDMVPDRRVAERVRGVVEAEGDRVDDLHLWRLGPGHLGAILSVNTTEDRGPAFYRERLARFPALSHVTVEVQRSAA